MPVIRKALRPEEVYPDDLRYNADTDKVQSLIDGEWVDNPLADPRLQTVFPPRLTSNPRCDAAESVKDALKNQIDQTCEAIDASKTVFTIAAIILAILSFGFFGVFIGLVLGLVNELIDIGTAAINASLTPTVYHTFVCILYCHMDSQGRLKKGELPAVIGEIDGTIGGVGALVLDKMLLLAGEGGVNNLASLGESTGDCSDCECGVCNLDDWLTGSDCAPYPPTFIAASSTGSEITRTADTITMLSGLDSTLYGMYRVDLVNQTLEGCYVALEVLAGAPLSYTRWYNVGEENANIHNNEFPATCTYRIYLLSNAPFTVKFTFAECPPEP